MKTEDRKTTGRERNEEKRGVEMRQENKENHRDTNQAPITN
jgi:hypothetical protein